jgi:hypothetical protein
MVSLAAARQWMLLLWQAIDCAADEIRAMFKVKQT